MTKNHDSFFYHYSGVRSIYTLYIDTFVLTICLVDFVAYLLGTYLLNRELLIRRCFLLAIGSAVSELVLYIVMPKYFLYRLLMVLVVNPLITVGVLYPAGRKKIFTGYLLITAVILFLGGIQTWFLYWLPLENGTWIWNILLALFAFLICIMYLCRRREQQCLYQVELTINGATIQLNAFHDTGNFLRDPFTGKMVNIVDASFLKDADIQNENIRYIPFHSVGQEHGLMPVMTIEKMVIRKAKDEIVKMHPVIGLTQQELFLRQDIQMILHSEIL